MIAIALTAIAIVIYFLFSPEESNIFPQCPFHYLTGLDCPGCGSQRAIHNILHFRIKEAFFFNPLLVISIPYLIYGIYMEYFGGKQKYPTARQIFFGKTATIIIFFIVIVYWVGRNVLKFI
ncbi:DUF2752 domain-containing protein [Dysgonomonas sp. ZJ709]|nr:DUF2752 domain-containing protein [Dysgonomonas sp. ZJ709]